MAEQPVWAPPSFPYGTERLDFRAAHHIGAIIGPIAYAGNDDCVVQPDGLINEVSQSSGAGHIRRFDPSTAGTDHAREQDGQIAEIRTDFRDSRRKTIVGNRKHRSEEQTSELQSLMRISYAVFCLKKTKR